MITSITTAAATAPYEVMDLDDRISRNHSDITSTREKLAQQEFDFTAELDKLNGRGEP